MSDFLYPAEKLLAARRSLMVPHPRGEAESIAYAFHECSLGLHDVDREDLDDRAREWVRELDRLMNTEGIEDDTGKGLWFIRADRLTESEKLELSRLVDDLARWFEIENYDQ